MLATHLAAEEPSQVRACINYLEQEMGFIKRVIMLRMRKENGKILLFMTKILTIIIIPIIIFQVCLDWQGGRFHPHEPLGSDRWQGPH